MELKKLGITSNHASKGSMNILGLWRDSISSIEIHNSLSTSSFFYDEYSHYIVVHDPIDMEFPERKDEWNKRFSREIGVSVVELLRCENNTAYVRGLFAFNGSNVYGILPYTSFDVYEAQFPYSDIEKLKRTVLDELLEKIKGKNILDIGCGVGSATLEIAENNPDSTVYGVEIEEELVKQCQLNAGVLGIDNAFFKTASIYDLPFEDNSIDSITCFFMLHHLEDIPAGIMEIKRILQNKGKVIAVDPKGHHHGPEISESRWKSFFEDAGFSVNVRSIGRAVVAESTILKE